MDQPDCLREEGKEQGCGEKLRASDALAGKKSGHKGEPSVLP